MRTLIILLIAGLCLVTAKYIPHDSSDANLALHRVRRSDSEESESNTASAERDDNSNDNDNEDSENNDSAEKTIKEEQNKLSEKDEKKKQKLLERLEKEKEKEIEKKRKLEEKLEKEQRKVQEKKEKEERKLQERIEKEKEKLEEKNRKANEKLEKEEKKRQEKLIKRLEKLQDEQIESAEDTYLETEEEDSVEMEDIWKAHVYDKYGISFTSTKLERQAALQRYLQAEMGINANSTKSERRQAILKLIQTKLQNDSAAVDSFRTLLLSHVNAAQIRKLKFKFEHDLEKLNNQTELLNNVSLPWASVAQQNIEEKRTFLQAIAQFLSNIVPNWFTGAQSSSNSTELNNGIPSNGILSNGIPVNSAPSGNSSISNDASGSGQTPQSVTNNDNTSLNSDIVGGESNLSVLPSNVDSGLNNSSSLSSQITGSGSATGNSLEASPSLNDNASISQSNGIGLPSNPENSVTVDSQNKPPLSSSGSTQNNPLESIESGSTVPISSGSLNNNAAVNQTGLNGQSSNTDQLTIDSSNLSSANSAPSSSNPSELSESVGSNTINAPVTQTSDSGLPSGTAANTNLSNTPASADSGSSIGTLSETNVIVDSGSLNNNVPVNEIDASGIPSNVDITANVDSTNTPALTNSELTPANPSESIGPMGSGSLNSEVPANEIAVSETNSNTGDLANVDSGTPLAPTDSETTASSLSNSVGSDVTSNISISPIGDSSAVSEHSPDNLSSPNELGENGSVINPSTAESEVTTGDVTQLNSSLSDVTSSAQPSTLADLEISSGATTGSVNLSGINEPISDITSDQSGVIPISVESAVSSNSESLNASVDANPSAETAQNSNDTSNVIIPEDNVPISNNIAVTSSTSDGNYEAPVENSNANTNETPISDNGENIPTEIVNETTTANTSGVNEAASYIDGAVQVSDTNTVSSDNTSTQVVTQNTSIPNLETDSTLENTNADGQVTDSLITTVSEANDVTQTETQTEQGNFLVQEIMNTPSDLIILPSVQDSSPSTLQNEIVPIEEGAAIVDIKKQ